jgi:hypothetical protein
VARHDQLHHTFNAAHLQRLDIVLEHGLERLLFAPFRVLGRQRFDPVEGECELGIVGLLDPKGAVVVEYRDSLLRRHVVRAILGDDCLDEPDDGGLGGAIAPGRQGVR